MAERGWLARMVKGRVGVLALRSSLGIRTRRATASVVGLGTVSMRMVNQRECGFERPLVLIRGRGPEFLRGCLSGALGIGFCLTPALSQSLDLTAPLPTLIERGEDAVLAPTQVGSEVLWDRGKLELRCSLEPMKLMDVCWAGGSECFAFGWRPDPEGPRGTMLGEVVQLDFDRASKSIRIAARSLRKDWLPADVEFQEQQRLIYVYDWTQQGLRVLPLGGEAGLFDDTRSLDEVAPLVADSERSARLRRENWRLLCDEPGWEGMPLAQTSFDQRYRFNRALHRVRVDSLVVFSRGKWVLLDCRADSETVPEFVGARYANEPLLAKFGKDAGRYKLWSAGADGPVSGGFVGSEESESKEWRSDAPIEPGAVLFFSEDGKLGAREPWGSAPSRRGLAPKGLPCGVNVSPCVACFAGHLGFGVRAAISEPKGSGALQAYLLAAEWRADADPSVELGTSGRLLRLGARVHGPVALTLPTSPEAWFTLPIGRGDVSVGREVVFQIVVEDESGKVLGVSDILGTTVCRADGFPAPVLVDGAARTESFVDRGALASDEAGRRLDGWIEQMREKSKEK